MNWRLTNRAPLRTHLLRAWMIAGGMTLATAVLMIVVLVYVDHSGRSSRITDDLRMKAKTVARRISAELLVGPNGVVQPVIEVLREEFKISSIELLPEGLSCTHAGPYNPTCQTLTQHRVWVEERLPNIQAERYVLIAEPEVSLLASLNFNLFIVGILPLLLLLGGGIVLQWSFVRRHLLNPINQLLESGGSAPEAANWPIEIHTVADKLGNLLQERDKAAQEALRLRTQIGFDHLSQKMLHDLKSPLGSLGIMLDTDLKDVPVEVRDKIRTTLSRIRMIVDSSLKEYFTSVVAPNGLISDQKESTPPAASIGGAVKTIIEEEGSRARQNGVTVICDLSRSAFLSFAPLSFSELCRVFSNLVGNAIEASLEGSKKVFVTASVSDTHADVVIRDYGKGFQPEVLQRILSGQRTTTKSSGTGLGLITAMNFVRQCGGDVTIQSLADGAVIRVRLPLVNTPPWFYDITRAGEDRIIALDDDLTIKDRLLNLFPGRLVSVVQTEEEFVKQSQEGSTSSLLLVDYDYGGQKNGLDLIISHGLTRQAVLLSGRIAFDAKIRSVAESQGIRLFPKECLG